MKPRNRNGEIIVYGDPTSTQALPARIPRDEAQTYGWVVERADGRTRPTKTHPEGQVRWVSKPERPVDLDTAIADLTRRRTEHRGEWDEAGSYTPPTYRIRNVYTGDVLPGDILLVGEGQPTPA